MMILRLLVPLLLILGVVLAPALESVSEHGWAAPLSALRTSSSTERLRIVLDSSAEIKFAVSKLGRQLIISLPESPAWGLKPRLDDELVKSVRLETQGKSSRVLIALSRDADYKVYRLKGPERLVIDFYRMPQVHTTEQLANGVIYDSYQDEIDGKQIRTYVVTIAPDADYELRPFSTAGVYNGRGLLSEAARLRSALVAVNSSYFDKDGWVIGNNKDRQQIFSTDSNPHSAFCVTQGKPSIVKDVAYSGTVFLPDGSELAIKGMNRARITDDLVFYNEYYAPTTKTNEWGREVQVDCASGRVLAASTAGNMEIAPGTYVLSGHGINAAGLEKISVGDIVSLRHSLGPVADAAETVAGGGPLLLEGGSPHVRTAEEATARDIMLGRSPRTALALKKDGSIILLVVDGRSFDSAGLTLDELARYLLRLGAVEAVNFDGGGSSAMIVRGRLMNVPSDGKERLVSMGLGLFSK